MHNIMKNQPNPDKCIACNTCLAFCPVARATSDFLGPRLIGPAFERFRLLGLSEEESLHFCSNCKSCDISCPSMVPISTFNMLARAAGYKRKKPPLRDYVLAHGEVLARLFRHVPAALKNFGMNNAISRLILSKLGISYQASLPPFAPEYFYVKAKKIPQEPHKEKVAYFPGCYINYYDPQAGLDMVWALNRAGYEVVFPEEFVCCGLPLVSNGFWQDARENAARNIKAMTEFAAKGIKVITGCPSCALMLKKDYPEYFPDIAAEDICANLEDICELLLERLEPFRERVEPVYERLFYHAPCHLRVQGIGLPGLELLRVFYSHVEEAKAGCCGISGSYGFKKDKYPIAMSVGEDLFRAMRESRAEISSSECGTCRLQMTHGTGMSALHPVSLVRRAVRE